MALPTMGVQYDLLSLFAASRRKQQAKASYQIVAKKSIMQMEPSWTKIMLITRSFLLQ